MNKFIEKKLDRALITSLIKENKINEAIKTYDNYQKDLKSLKKNKKLSKEVNKEINYSKKEFTEKLAECAKNFNEKKDYTNALICYKKIFELDKTDTKNLNNYIKCLDSINEFDLELDLAKNLLSIEKSSDNYKTLSSAYNKNEKYNLAIWYYNKYLNKANKTADAVDNNTLGCHYFNKYCKKGENPKDAELSLKYFSKSLKAEPRSKIYLKNTIVAAMKHKDFETEKKYWTEYINLGYMNADDEFTYSASCMRNGDIEGWKKYYNSRFRKDNMTIYPKIDKPEWTGKEDLSDKTLLVHYEQGFGDNFLMFGYVPRLIKLAKHVIYYIQNDAYELVKDNEFGVEVQSPKTKSVKDMNFDYHVPCMSLPIVLDLTKVNISVEGGYIKPDKNLVIKFKEKYFNDNKFKIGIAFEGVSANAKRNIPIEKLTILDKLDDVEIYCFTKDIEDEKLKCFKNHKIINIAKDFNNFADTAAAIENTDIILTSDNCILNLAGAIGKRAIAIFNYHYEFRWYDLTGEDCGWYKSVKPIVNDKYNDWDKSITKAVNIIKELIVNK